MNAFPSDTLYRSQLARNQELLAEAAAERHARFLLKTPMAGTGVVRMVVCALRRRPATPAVVTHWIATAD